MADAGLQNTHAHTLMCTLRSVTTASFIVSCTIALMFDSGALAVGPSISLAMLPAEWFNVLQDVAPKHVCNSSLFTNIANVYDVERPSAFVSRAAQ